ncbi:neutral protease 2 [Favolaschia claudopus]|uniref:Neutral protease 2 n=1 Tax=Favolaschia claudopus TaxID=2862362 RepID=A0AAW0CW74_9AGAR
MFRFGVLLSFTAVALALSSGDLRVFLKPVSSSVNSIDDIVLTAVVSNPTDQDIRVIAKNNVLDNSATSSFAVSKGEDGVLFTGVRTTLDLSADALYVTIPAGSSIAVNHTRLGPLFDFQTHGTGKFKFAPKTVFQTGYNADPLHVDTDAVEVSVTHDVAKRELIPLERRLSTPTCSDSGRLQVLKDSLSYARSLAGGAATDINSHPNGPEYTSYFAGNKQSDIWYNMDRIAGDLASSGTRKIFCTGDPANLCGANGGVIAYTLVVTSGGNIVGSDIYMCDYFFTSVGTTPGICTGGYDATQSSRGGVLLHELSHATAGTADIAYGCSACAKLGTADKKNNADNYRCMGLAIYKDYNC